MKKLKAMIVRLSSLIVNREKHMNREATQKATLTRNAILKFLMNYPLLFRLFFKINSFIVLTSPILVDLLLILYILFTALQE